MISYLGESYQIIWQVPSGADIPTYIVNEPRVEYRMAQGEEEWGRGRNKRYPEFNVGLPAGREVPAYAGWGLNYRI